MTAARCRTASTVKKHWRHRLLLFVERLEYIAMARLGQLLKPNRGSLYVVATTYRENKLTKAYRTSKTSITAVTRILWSILYRISVSRVKYQLISGNDLLLIFRGSMPYRERAYYRHQRVPLAKLRPSTSFQLFSHISVAILRIGASNGSRYLQLLSTYADNVKMYRHIKIFLVSRRFCELLLGLVTWYQNATVYRWTTILSSRYSRGFNSSKELLGSSGILRRIYNHRNIVTSYITIRTSTSTGSLK